MTQAYVCKTKLYVANNGFGHGGKKKEQVKKILQQASQVMMVHWIRNFNC